jgi:DNA-binding SARP family transcriptional activator
MPLQIHLIGRPAIIDADGKEQSLRGHQAWVLLARILLSKRPLDRRVLAGELFPDVSDPLGALRWCLGSIRKATGVVDSLKGDPIRLNLPEDAQIDVFRLNHPGFVVDDLGEFLEGIEPRCSLELSTWLLVERESIASAMEELIRDRTLRALSAGDNRSAIRLAELGVRRSPFDESAHILLVKSLTDAGRHTSAYEHIDSVEKTFIAELGERPSAALWSAARRTIAAPPAGVRPQAVVKSQMESGLAALAAGATDAGIDCLRRSVAAAERVADRHLSATATLELGVALVHSIRGHDDEGAILLRQSIALAEECGARALAAKAYRELGYVEALAGRRPAAASILQRGLELADDAEARSGIHAVAGFNLIDWGNLSEGLEHYERSLSNARSAGSRRREIWALGLGAWGLLAAGRFQEAEEWLQKCLVMIDEQRWVAFRPWPLAILAEARLRQQHEPASLRAGLEDAFALSCQIGDPCWEGISARSMALTYIATDELQLAGQWLLEARGRCVRETDTYAALLVTIVADQMKLSLRVGQAKQAEDFARELIRLATRSHMNGYVSLAQNFVRR